MIKTKTKIAQISNKLNLLIDSPWKVILIFSVIGLFAILNHSMWRDEMNTWLIVRDSNSFLEMVNNVHYQGHPLLWALSISFLYNFVKNPLIMQLFHLCLAITAMIIFWQYSPFKKWQKILFTFGYLPFYEYLVISRNYTFGMLFLWAFCATFNSRKKTYLILAVILGLMANSNAYALFISCSLGLMLLVEFCFDKNHRQEYFKKAKKYDFFLSLFILISLYILSIYILSPPPDSANHGGQDGFFFAFELKRFFIALGKLFSGYILITPKKQWLDLIICSIISLLLFGFTIFRLSKKPLPLFFYVVGTGFILAFNYFRFIIADFRHFGHFYLILLAAFWLANYYEDSALLSKIIPLNKKQFTLVNQGYSWVLMLILVANFLGGINGLTRDILIPYSASRETANYIKQADLNDEFIVGSEDAQMAALSGYLYRKFYYPELQRIGSFTLFIKERVFVKHELILEQIKQILQEKTDLNKVLLILNKQLKVSHRDLKITPIKEFKNSFNRDEKYYLYWGELIKN